jgi:hypothetical protein
MEKVVTDIIYDWNKAKINKNEKECLISSF